MTGATNETFWPALGQMEGEVGWFVDRNHSSLAIVLFVCAAFHWWERPINSAQLGPRDQRT